MESGAILEMPSFTETSESEESITRMTPTETNSYSELPTEEKESSVLEECFSDMTSQLVSIKVLMPFNILHTLSSYCACS